MSQHHDLGAERALLACVLLDNLAMDLIGELAAEAWYSPQNAAIWAACRRLYTRREPIDAVTLRAEIDRMGDLKRAGGDEHLLALLEHVPTSANAEHYAAIIRQHAAVRRVVTECQTIIVEAGRPIDDPDAFVDAAEARVHRAGSDSRSDDGLQDAAELMASTLADLQKREERKGEPGLSYGFKALDRLTCGMEPGELVVVAGRPGMGKSAFAQEVALAAARQDAATLVFSLEMENVAWGRRLVQSQASVRGDRVKAGAMNREEWGRVASAADSISKLPLHIQHAPGLSFYQLRSKARRFQARHGLGLVVLDYLQLMSWHERMSTREQEVEAISKGMKQLAMELGCPVLALAQLNRELEKRTDKRPQPSDLRNSGALEQDADVILFVYRQYVYTPNNTDPRAAEIIIGKQRSGAVGTAKATWRAEYTRFEDFDPNEFSDDQRAMGAGRW